MSIRGDVDTAAITRRTPSDLNKSKPPLSSYGGTASLSKWKKGSDDYDCTCCNGDLNKKVGLFSDGESSVVVEEMAAQGVDTAGE